MSHLTEAEIEALQDSGLDRDTPYAIQGVINTQLSIARYYGGCKFMGRNYSYIPSTDELIRDDVVRWLAKYRKARKVNEPKQEQGGLFDGV